MRVKVKKEEEWGQDTSTFKHALNQLKNKSDFELRLDFPTKWQMKSPIKKTIMTA